MTANVVPSNVKLPLSSNSPEDPAITTRLSVRSLTCAELTTKPPAIFAPPFASIAPLIVVIPDMATLPFVCIVVKPTVIPIPVETIL